MLNIDKKTTTTTNIGKNTEYQSIVNCLFPGKPEVQWPWDTIHDWVTFSAICLIRKLVLTFTQLICSMVWIRSFWVHNMTTVVVLIAMNVINEMVSDLFRKLVLEYCFCFLRWYYKFPYLPNSMIRSHSRWYPHKSKIRSPEIDKRFGVRVWVLWSV